MKNNFTFGKIFNMLRIKLFRGIRVFNVSSGTISVYFNMHPENDYTFFCETRVEIRIEKRSIRHLKSAEISIT